MVLSLILAGSNVRLAILPLAGFVALCIAAPFFPRLGFFVPVISRGRFGKNAVALTFDDGPDPNTTPKLLRLLAAYNVPATFFVTGARADNNPDLVRDIITQGHDVGNHSYSHDPLLMLRGQRTLTEEISRAQSALNNLGINPFAFRPPVGITNPKLEPVLRNSGLYTLTFSRRAFDRGNRQINNLAKKILRRIQPGDIVLLHDRCPKPTHLIPAWLEEIETLLNGITDRGLRVLPVSEMIGKPVMEAVPQDQSNHHPLDDSVDRTS